MTTGRDRPDPRCLARRRRARGRRRLLHLLHAGRRLPRTDPAERWTRDEFRQWAHPRFATGKAWTMTSTRRWISLGGDGKVVVRRGPAVDGAWAGAGKRVLVRVGDTWKIAAVQPVRARSQHRFDAVKRLISAQERGRYWPSTSAARAQRLGDVAEVGARRVAPARVDLGARGQRRVPFVHCRDHRVQRIAGRRADDDAHFVERRADEGAEGKNVTALRNARTRCGFSRSPASLARMRHACSGSTGGR